MVSSGLAECHIENEHVIVSSLDGVLELYVVFNVDLNKN